jgi:ATP-dependent DNA ligase
VRWESLKNDKLRSRVRLYSRPGNDLPDRFPLIVEHDADVFLYAFDLLELNGDDLRRDPLEVRKATLRGMLAALAVLALPDAVAHCDALARDSTGSRAPTRPALLNGLNSAVGSAMMVMLRRSGPAG